MASLNLKRTHKSIKDYYESLEKFDQLGVTHEGAVRVAFQSLLEHCARKQGQTLLTEYAISNRRGKRIVIDGAIVDNYSLTHGFWEAKDIHDDLPAEVERKFAVNYPKENILFQTPKRAILWQENRQVLDADLTNSDDLIDTLELFFAYRPLEYLAWEEAAARFSQEVAEIGQGLAKIIKKERQVNLRFIKAFEEFLTNCRQSIDPTLSRATVEEMLIQHLLTERLFRTVFDNPDFAHRNVIANEIERVIRALTSQAFSRDSFLQSLDRYYVAIEMAAGKLHSFSQKQDFLNNVYEQFFQGFSEKVADTHGIVYTPQTVVDFMVHSVETILKTEFNHSLADKNVHIIDPFVGTGNFIVRILREIPRTAIQHKYACDLHCNEVLLLPYYIASMNIEHEYFSAAGAYEPFEGICLVDTFELASSEQPQQMSLNFMAKNTSRVKAQQENNITVVVGNPPWNAGQANENDNNKNPKHPTLDRRVRDTYSSDSQATLKSNLSDPYVKAIRWAADRIGEEGVVAFVTNNSFLDAVAFDGMRKHLALDFSKIYHINLKGNANTSGERRRKEGGNIFDDKIKVGVGISFFVKKGGADSKSSEIWIYSVDDCLKSFDKQELLSQFTNCANVPMKKVAVDQRYFWLTDRDRTEFETFVPLGIKEVKEGKKEAVDVIFHKYSLGVSTNRDGWVRKFDLESLKTKCQSIIETYNSHVFRWERRLDQSLNVDDFVDYEDNKISWSSTLKSKLKQGKIAEFNENKVRLSLYRPFTSSYLFFDRTMNDRPALFPTIFPTENSEVENRAICVSAVGNKKPFHCLMTNQIPDLHLTGDSQCFPFYIYDEDGSNRRENITDWALDGFRSHFKDFSIGKWDIFNYLYGLLHHPKYRERYQNDLRRQLPRIPLATDFHAFSVAGSRLAKLHVDYEEQPEYPLNCLESPGFTLNWLVEKMSLSKDNMQIKYNDFLTLGGVPDEVLSYRLGDKSALEWIIDQYCIEPNESGDLVDDPNRIDDPKYILRLIGKVITVSIETMKVVKNLPALEITDHTG